MSAARLQPGYTRRPQPAFTARRARGFILLSVVLALILVAAVAFLLNRSGAMNMRMAAGGLEADSARYVAEAGIAQANTQAQGRNCAGYTDLAPTAFGPASFTATVNPKLGSPVTLVATGTTAGGATAKLTRSNVVVYTATPLSLQPDAASGIDAWLNAKNSKSDTNYGVDTLLWLDSSASNMSRPLIKFDLSAIPPASAITAATLSLYQTAGNVSASPPNPVINVHRLTRAWVEGTKLGSGSADGATWDSADTIAAWTTPGGDFDPSVAASTPANEITGWKTWDVRALVAGWVSGAYPNNGMLLNAVGTISVVRFASSDDSTAATRPKLEVTFPRPCS